MEIDDSDDDSAESCSLPFPEVNIGSEAHQYIGGGTFVQLDHHDHGSRDHLLPISSGEVSGEETTSRLVPGAPGGDFGEDATAVKQLTNSIIATTDRPLSDKARVYPGVQKFGMFTRKVAVKIVSFSEKRMREAKNLMKLTPHVNVVSIIHADMVPKSVVKSIYIVMEQCQTMSLESYYQKRKKERIPFNTRLALELARQALEGINHIHRNNIIHRDLRPSSFLFSLDGKNLKIVDFGLSKELEYGMTTMSVSTLEIGADGFRAPETYNKDEIKRLADIFSLAIVLYHIWSYGLHPFGDEPSLWSYNIKSGEPPDLNGLLVPDRDNAEDLLKHMLKNEHRERYRITNALTHSYISQGVLATLLHGMKKVWEGRMQIREYYSDGGPSTSHTDCIFYQREGQPGLGNDEQELKFKLNYFKCGGVMKMVIKNIGGKPDGFLSLPKDKYLKMMKEISSHKVGWVKVLKNNKDWRAFLIFSPRGYEELFGVYVEDLCGLIASLEHHIVESSIIPGTSSSGARWKRRRSLEGSTTDSSKSIDSNFLTVLGRQPDDTVEDEDETCGSLGGMGRMPTEIDLPEYISWWFYKPPSQSPQNWHFK